MATSGDFLVATDIITHPCANCGRRFEARTALTIYCTDLCVDVASWIRYYQGVVGDGRIRDLDVREAMGIKLAHIAGGGYPRRERRPSEELRRAVTERDGGVCRQCGALAREIDHISGSSSDLSNLQLLCYECHVSKTLDSMAPADDDTIESVHQAIQGRALEDPIRQPCDWTEWNHRHWIEGSKNVSQRKRAEWLRWNNGPGSKPLSPAIAVVGFPGELDPWSWYVGTAPPKKVKGRGAWRDHWPSGGIPITVSGITEPDVVAMFGAEMATSISVADDPRAALITAARTVWVEPLDRPVAQGRNFRAPASGKGKWHLTYAEAPDLDLPESVLSPETKPVCGSPTVEVDPLGRVVRPVVGRMRSEYSDRLCGNCLRLA